MTEESQGIEAVPPKQRRPTKEELAFERERLLLEEQSRREHAISREATVQARKTALTTAIIAVIAGLLGSVLSLAAGSAEGKRAREQYLNDQQRAAYSAFAHSVGAMDLGFATYGSDLTLRMKIRGKPLSETETVTEVNKLITRLVPLAGDLRESQADMRLVSTDEIVNLAEECVNKTLDPYDLVIEAIEAYGKSIAAGDSKADELENLDDKAAKEACKAFDDAARRDITR